MNNLILEIGTEEIPAGYIEPSLKFLSSLIGQKLISARVGHGSIRTFGTPRRLAVMVENVADKQESLTTEIIGPPEKIGFDEKGKATIAAEKFAEKAGVPVDKLSVKNTKKGTYLCAVKTEPGYSAKMLLKTILPDAVKSIPFPKTMRWADLEISFARPIQSILALLGPDVISFVLAGIRSGRYTFGHRFMCPGRIKISAADNYIDSLYTGCVLAHIPERKKKIEKGIGKAVADLDGAVLADNELLDIVTNLVEYPVIAVGKIDRLFLELPREILITAMREHQKYFAVVDKENNLMPFFIAVTNTQAEDMTLVARGHERVLRARLDDAQFFYKNDLRRSFEDLTDQLKGVLFQADLGSMYEKVVRIQKLSGFLVNSIIPSSYNRHSSERAKQDSDAMKQFSDLRKHVLRAAFLCKTDLVSEIVTEFPKLQGIMGRVYASVAGEADIVAIAIEEHYRPIYSGGHLPSTDEAALLAIADKIDSICGCFGIGLIPTGTSDPYALRRQGIGIIQIMLDRSFTFRLKGMIEKSLELYDMNKKAENADRVYGFFKNRMAHLLAEEGFSRDVITAVIDISADHIPNVWKKVHALEKLKAEPDFEPLAVSFKRVVNILKQADYLETEIVDIDENLFQHKSESKLYDTYKIAKKSVSENLNRKRFDKALLVIAAMRDSIDAFFDDVMVMTDQADIRTNRLLLLRHIADLFGLFADFSKIST